MRILALVPARGNSQRISGKNLRQLGSKPLVVWPIDAAKDMPEVCDILVSTDDPRIADVARSAGALVPWLRPPALATDAALVIDAALHALNWYEDVHGPVDGLLLLQPTSPFTSRSTIHRGTNLFGANNYQSVLGVSFALSHPMRCFTVDGVHLTPYLPEHDLQIRSQDLPPAYVVNGCFYLSAPAVIRENHALYGKTVIPLVIESRKETIDIDTEWDWQIAQWAVDQKGLV